MKTAFTILAVLVLAVLICGCTNTAPAATPPPVSPTTQPVSATSAIPDMMGLWKGTGTGYTTTDNFYDYPVSIFNITKQKGQIFTGRKEYPKSDGKTYYENFSGIVTPDGRVYESDSIGGFALGKLTGPDSLELNYLEDGPDAKAIILTLSRQKS
ncbi:hypothetical protein [uncultured Methanoregula sp.]|uniref:hypothetical protein n=1 Tax=uncultured Methanoregula sp. TaxID=1005933 RepID=UPI002AAC29E1|nr:hypothetical protein [uncultured Methanoregula sp.]